MPRIVRRAPLVERIKSYLNVMDFLLWLSEELETHDWDSKRVGTQLGMLLSFVFMIARANSEGATDVDMDMFGDGAGTGWVQYLAVSATWLLVPFSAMNALYAFCRTRQYRLFEANVEQAPATPSARRVRVQSTPVSSSPMRFISGMFAPQSAEERAHPDASRDVWELSVWDPLPLSLRLLCFFSPGHVLVYMLFLPIAQLDERPSVTVASCLFVQAVMSAQMLALAAQFAQQAKDQAVIQREVMNEYDTKFVRPRLHPTVCDVGTQVGTSRGGYLIGDRVDVGTPTTIIRRGFRTHPNPNYAMHIDPDGSPAPSTRPRMFKSTNFNSGLGQPAFAPTPTFRPVSSRESMPASPPKQPATAVATATDFGGSMGVYTHARSPLKKTMSMGNVVDPPFSPRNSLEMAAIEQQLHVGGSRHSSPVKSIEAAGVGRNHPNPFRPYRIPHERYPSRC